MHVRQRIEIKPNNKQKTYFLKCFGLTRLAYNWGLEEWERMYAAKENPKWGEVRAHFNAIKHEDFPFVEEVSSHVTQEAFRNLGKAYKNYRTSIKKKDWMYGKPIKKSAIAVKAVHILVVLTVNCQILTKTQLPLRQYNTT